MSVQGERRAAQPLEKEMQREVNQRGEGRGVQQMERVGKRSWVRWSGEDTESQPGLGRGGRRGCEVVCGVKECSC